MRGLFLLLLLHTFHSLITLMLLSGDPRRPYPTDLEMRSGMLGHMANLPTNGVNGHLPGDALAAGRLPGESDRLICLTCKQVKLLSEEFSIRRYL